MFKGGCPATFYRWWGIRLLRTVLGFFMPQREAAGLVTALNPCRKLGCFQADACAVAVAGEDRGGLG